MIRNDIIIETIHTKSYNDSSYYELYTLSNSECIIQDETDTIKNRDDKKEKKYAYIECLFSGNILYKRASLSQ